MANHQTNFTSNFGEMGETGNAAFVLNVNGTSHTYHPVGSDVSVDVATVRRILATAPNLAQSIASVLAAGGYPILVYDGSEYGYIKTVNSKYVFTCLDGLNGVKQAEVDIQDGTITAGTGGVDGVSILARTDSDLFLKITTAITLGRIPIISDTGVYYQLIAKTGTIAQFGRITGTGALEVLTVNNSDQITSSSFVFVQDPYYVHTDNNFTNAYKTAVEANTTARHTHDNKPILDRIEQTDIDNWDGKLSPTGDVSNTTSTFTKASGDTSSIASGSKLSAIFSAISSFFASLKALAFKDKVSDSDISGMISDGHIASESVWNGKYTKPSTGIPKTDLASAVQTSLGKADSALQNHQSVTDSNPTLAWGTTSTVGTVGSTNLRVTMPSNPASTKYTSFTNFDDFVPAVSEVVQYNINGDYTNGPSEAASKGYWGVLQVFWRNAFPYQLFFNSTNMWVRYTTTRTGDSWTNWNPWTLINSDASSITSGTFGTDRIADDAITAAKVKDNETLPVNISGKAATAVKNEDSVQLIYGMYAMEASSHTIPDLLDELRVLHGARCGSMEIQSTYTKDNVTIETGWYNFEYIPHRGDAAGDSRDFGTLLLSGMTVTKTFYVFHYKNSKVNHLWQLTNTEGSYPNMSVGNAGNAKKWDGHAISVGTVVSNAGTISIA